MVANNAEESSLFAQGFQAVGGLDESGMGCFSGSVVVGLVIFPPIIDYRTFMPGLNDSKQKTPEQRDVLYDQVRQHARA